MKIEVTVTRCLTCSKYTQYFVSRGNEFIPIDCGFCGQQQRITKPWNRCKLYLERSNIGGVFKVQGKAK